MVAQERRRSGYGGCLIVLLLLMVIYLWLAPVFFAARDAARYSRRFDDGRRLARAVKRYAEGHKGLLPGAGWTDALEGADPGLQKDVWREEDEARLGYAAIPGTLGCALEGMDAETILFVETLSGRLNDVAHDLYDLGGRTRTGTAIAITVDDVRQEYPRARMRPLVEIGMQLQRQHTPGLKGH